MSVAQHTCDVIPGTAVLVGVIQNCSLIGGVCVFLPATQLKPDEGTPELPEGRVRVRLESDGTLHDVTEYEIEKVATTQSLSLSFSSEFISSSVVALSYTLSFLWYDTVS